MTGNSVIRTGGATVGLYSPAVATVPGSGLVFVSGVLSVDTDGNSFGTGDFALQMTTVFRLLGETLAAAGSSFSELVKMTTYLVDPDQISDFYDVRVGLFEQLYPNGNPPGNTLLVVRRLVRPEFLIEVEGVATTTRSQGDTDEFVS